MTWSAPPGSAWIRRNIKSDSKSNKGIACNNLRMMYRPIGTSGAKDVEINNLEYSVPSFLETSRLTGRIAGFLRLPEIHVFHLFLEMLDAEK
jgi:hypothetical protein